MDKATATATGVADGGGSSSVVYSGVHSGGGGGPRTCGAWVDVFNPDEVSPNHRDDVLRALVVVDRKCFPDPRHRTVAALQNSPQLRRATKIIVAWWSSSSSAAAAAAAVAAEGSVGGVGVVVGFVTYVVGSMEFSITKVAVAPESRRLGLGETMTRAAVEAAKKRNAKVVRLRVETTGLPALALYRKIGFAEEKDRPPSMDFYGPGRHALHLALHL